MLPTLRRPSALLPSLLLLALAAGPAAGQDRRTLTFPDLMKVRQVADPSISADGRWLAFTAAPDRGDAEVVVKAVDGDARFVVATADRPVLSADGAWVAARTVPSLAARETADDPGSLRNGLAVVALPGGAVETMADVRAFGFSPDGRFLAYHRYAPEATDEDGDEGDGRDGNGGEEDTGTELVVRTLATGAETVVADVRAFAFADEGGRLAYWVASNDDARDGVYVRDPADGTERGVDARPDGRYAALTWSAGGTELAFVVAGPDDGGAPEGASVRAWDGDDTRTLVAPSDAPDGWIVPTTTSLSWSDDGARLFFGWRPLRADETGATGGGAGNGAGSEDGAGSFDPYDVDAILADRGVDVWHWRDERIMPQQKVTWTREKDRTYLAVHHRDGSRTVALGGPDLPDVRVPDNASVALADSDVPYRWEATWMGGQSDAYLVDLATGARTRFAERIRGNASLSPGGGYAVWWHDGAYHLHDVAAGATRNLTADLGVPMADEDWDYPEPAPGYGVAGWLEGDAAVLLNDKYDIWVVPTDGGAVWSLTDGQGRRERRVFRRADGRDDAPVAADATLTLLSYHDLRKNYGFYSARADRPGVTRLLEEDKRFRYLATAEDAGRVLYTREAYDEFPDLWVADSDFSGARKVTDVNPGLIDTFAWGTAELLEWRSVDGTPLQGVVIKPGNYVEGRRYPVLVYYYRFFSQRLHEFNDPSVNHRPSFPIYASDDYVVFLPDVRFEVGRPGLASTKSVVPGVQKLIDVGLADPDAIALHGHSWSGYQTAFMVTQTNIFRTAIAGAPVANMTSAYSGIRLGSGLARQFQYEQSQSRIGASMWEALDEYVENSPVFYADRIETPLLILHGDVDDAVPWEQSIELYLAMRRLGKEAVFLQYRDEPHHPQTYANKLDWAVKMKEWTDHWLKGAPAPKWITEGMPYRGR